MQKFLDLINQNKIELVEEFAVHYMEAYGLPPLAAKIYAYLLMDCKKEGITFDELVEVFNVSKSSVSNSLHLLSQHKHIEQFTKIDQRKRLYRVSPEHIILRLKKIHNFLLREKYLSEKYKCYREEAYSDDTINQKGSEIYSEHLTKCIAQMSETVEKLEQLNQNI